ncbi:1-acyl-sn-glycerol-3-phosphate acyltransferase [Yimella sp. cx-573]|nr:1-acyl-sn-glycerol-3-phosphate acyltransferase [Yimella sp. cx-573]
MEPVYTPVRYFARGLFAAQGLCFKRTGQENIPATGGGVVAMNHFGYLDFALGGYAYEDAGRLVRFMAKKEVFDLAGVGTIMRGMKHIPVDRAAGAGAYRVAVEALKAGELIGVFPEATISRSFELKEFKTGAARMAQEAGVPILPTVVWGSHRIWTKDHPKRLGRSKIPVTVTVGAPIMVGPQDDPSEVMAELKSVMKRMLDQAKDEYEPLVGDEAVYLPAALGGKAPTLEEAAALEVQERARRAERKAAKAAAKQAKKS